MFSSVARAFLGSTLKSGWSWVSLFCVALLVGCGGGTSQQSQSGDPPPLASNWQFTMAGPSDGSFAGGIQSAFLSRSNNALTGNSVYAIALSANSNFCNSGSAPITGTISGQNVTLTAIAGGQTYTLNGSLSADGSTMMGTYSLTANTSVVGSSPCGTAQTGLQWSARSVPPLSGDVTGFFHSQVTDRLFPITGTLMQADNAGASTAPITGTLTFQGYSCLGSSSHQTVSINGEISGKSAILQVIADSGLNVGQIGSQLTSRDLFGLQRGTNGSTSPVFFETRASAGNVLHGITGYGVTTKSCPSQNVPGDYGNVCLALADAKDCTEPISLFPAKIEFPPMLVGSSRVSQTITLMNTDPLGATVTGLSLTSLSKTFIPNSFEDPSDFNGLPNFTEVDTCASSPGSSFDLAPQQSCLVTVSFSPQQSCDWMPVDGSATAGRFLSPAKCPPYLTATVPTPPALGATLRVTGPQNASGTGGLDSDTSFTLPISGVGLSAVVPSVPELDFGAEAISEASSPQALSFANQGTHPVQILPAATTPCAGGTVGRPLTQPVLAGQVSGLLVVQGSVLDAVPSPTSGVPNTVQYACDVDPTSGLSNFQISSDTCTGRLLGVGETCSVNITYVPQPSTDASSGLDYFLELNTQQCNSTSLQPNCEIDSGRFPVELKANRSSTLRMFPAAGLNFGIQPKGIASAPLTIRLSNDANDPKPGTVDLKGNVVTGDYTETDDCPGSLAPGASCILSIVFNPQSNGFDQGTLTITYLVPGSNIAGTTTQIVYLRGTGQ
jgi:hypothetical protein